MTNLNLGGVMANLANTSSDDGLILLVMTIVSFLAYILPFMLETTSIIVK